MRAAAVFPLARASATVAVVALRLVLSSDSYPSRSPSSFLPLLVRETRLRNSEAIAGIIISRLQARAAVADAAAATAIVYKLLVMYHIASCVTGWQSIQL
jgi:hypothetical protein